MERKCASSTSISPKNFAGARMRPERDDRLFSKSPKRAASQPECGGSRPSRGKAAEAVGASRRKISSRVLAAQLEDTYPDRSQKKCGQLLEENKHLQRGVESPPERATQTARRTMPGPQRESGRHLAHRTGSVGPCRRARCVCRRTDPAAQVGRRRTRRHERESGASSSSQSAPISSQKKIHAHALIKEAAPLIEAAAAANKISRKREAKTRMGFNQRPRSRSATF